MEEKPLVTIKTKIEKEDYRKFMYIDFLSKKINQIAFGVYLICFLILLIILLLFILMNDREGITKLTGYIVICIGVFILFPIMFEYRLNRTYKTDKTGMLTSYQIVEFYEDCIISRFEKEEEGRKRNYNQFYSVFESKDLILIYHNAFLASIIRKKDIDREILVTLLNLLKIKFRQNYKTSKKL